MAKFLRFRKMDLSGSDHDKIAKRSFLKLVNWGIKGTGNYLLSEKKSTEKQTYD